MLAPGRVRCWVLSGHTSKMGKGCLRRLLVVGATPLPEGLGPLTSEQVRAV